MFDYSFSMTEQESNDNGCLENLAIFMSLCPMSCFYPHPLKKPSSSLDRWCFL